MRNKSQSPSDQTGTGNNDNIKDIPGNSSPRAEKSSEIPGAGDITSGDKRAIKYVEQKKRIQELENDKRRHQKNVYMADGNIKRHLENAELAAKAICELKDFFGKFGNLDLLTADISIDGKKISGDRKDIMAQLERDVFEKINSSPWMKAKINIGGLQISVYSEEIIRITAPVGFATVYTIDNIRSQQGISIKGNANTAQGFMSSLQSLLKKKPDELAALQEKESSLRALAEQQKQIKNSTFAQETELNDLIKEHEALEKELAEDSKNKGADEKHMTLSQAISMLGLDTSDIEVEDDTDSDLKLSMTGDGNYADKIELHQMEAQKKITDELFLFRDLPRGSRLDNTSVTAVRQLLENNVAAFPEKIKKGFVKFFESLVSFKPPKGMGTITAENFVTSATTAGLLRKDGESAYLTIGDNTLRVSHHNTSVETFEKHGEADNNILSIVFEKRDAKPFKGKDSVNAIEYVYKTEDLTGVKAALVWYDISTFLKTGIYTDHVGANHVHYSGSVEFKEAAKKKVEADKQAMSKPQLTTDEEADLQNNEQLAEEVGNGIRFSLVTDKKIIDKLDAEEKSGDYLTLYRSVQIGPDGKLHSPMAAKIAGKWGPEIKLGEWEQADERPELSKAKIAKDGKIKYLFDLNKGNGKTIGGVLYNPYIHSSNVMLNDQFSEAYQRPELVTVEVHVPESELTSGYKAKRANDAVGMKDWKAGVVQSKLTGKRKVMLSRWDKPVRIVPDSEVAQHIKELIAGKDIAIPANVVTPSLRAELEKIGVEIDYSVKEYVPERERTAQPELKLSLTTDRKTAQKESLLAQVKTLLDEQKPVVTPDWVKENRAVYEALYKYVFPSAWDRQIILCR